MYDLTGFQRDLLYTIAGLDNPHGLGKGGTREVLREGDTTRKALSEPGYTRREGTYREGSGG